MERPGWLRCLALLPLFAASPAWAQGGGMIFGGGGGAAFPVGNFGDAFQEGGLWSGFLGVGIHDYADLLVRVQESFHDLKEEEEFVVFGDTDVTLISVTAGPKFFLTPASSPVRPFIAVEGGWSRIENDDGGGLPIADDDRVAFDGGGGIEFGGPAWRIGTEARYFRSFGDGDEEDLEYVVPMLSFTFRMLP